MSSITSAPPALTYFLFFYLHFSSPLSSVGGNGSTGPEMWSSASGKRSHVGVCYGDEGRKMISGLWMKIIVRQEPQNGDLHVTVPL